MKRFTLLLFLLCFLGSIPAFASPGISLLINGKDVKLDYFDPVIESGRVFVPVRAVMENLDAKVEWDGSKVIIKTDDITAVVPSYDFIAYSNGTPVKLDVKPKMLNNHLFVPIRAVGELLGKNVSWNAAQEQVIINDIKKEEKKPEVQISWSKSFQNISGELLIYNNNLYVSNRNTVHCLNLADGNQIWQHVNSVPSSLQQLVAKQYPDTTIEMYGAPKLFNNKILIPSSSRLDLRNNTRFLLLLDTKGNVIWDMSFNYHNYSLSPKESSMVTVNNDEIYLAGQRSIAQLDQGSNVVWEKSYTSDVSDIAIDRYGYIYFGEWGNKTNYLRCLDSDGSMIWESNINGDIKAPPVFIDSERFIVRVNGKTSDKLLYFTTRSYGSARWDYELPSKNSVVNVKNGNIYIADGSDLITLNTDGKELERQVIPEGVVSFVVQSEELLVALNDGRLCQVVNGKIKSSIQLDSKVKYQPQILPNGEVIVSTENGSIYRVKFPI